MTQIKRRISLRIAIALMLSVALPAANAVAQRGPTSVAQAGVDWPTFLARHDLIWDRLPAAWDEGPFMGNGMLGMLLYQEPSSGLIRVDLGRSDVQDHRRDGSGAGYGTARLPIGRFLLQTVGRIRPGGKLRLHLRDAETIGELVTDRGTIALRAYVHATRNVMVVEATPSAGERGLAWRWVGEQAESPRQTWGRVRNDPRRVRADYKANPVGVETRVGRDGVWRQPLLVGGGTTTTWREDKADARHRLLVSIAHSWPGDTSERRARADLAAAAAIAPARLMGEHRAWWRAFYPKSFLSLSDTRMESFYWIQLYKLASATRADGVVVDNQGPWLQPTAWPYATWNLNVQLTYWPTFASNHLDLAQSLVRSMDRYRGNLAANVAPELRDDSLAIGTAAGTELVSPVSTPSWIDSGRREWGSAPEAGNAVWALHDVWLYYRHSMDERVLRDTLFPLLRRGVNYYRHLLRPGADGRLHLPVTSSPEYGAALDANYDLALLRWGAATLLAANDRLKLDDPLVPAWRDILARLTPYPEDKTGFNIGAGVPYAMSHRHYSHLLMAYPLYLVNRDQPGAAERIQRSIEHWQSKPKALAGYSTTGAASLSAALGKGDQALGHLRQLWSRFLRPNTLYKEQGPVIETPLSGAQSILDMLLQSWGGRVRPFPAMPSSWPDAVFADLRAEGAFLVGGERRSGRTQWISVRSLAGEPLELELDFASPGAEVAGKPRSLVRVMPNVYRLALARGEQAVIRPAGSDIVPIVRPVAATVDDLNSYGLNARSVLSGTAGRAP